MKYDAPLIITGSPRTGTTGLQVALSALPKVCIWYEFELYSQLSDPFPTIVNRGERLVARQHGGGPFDLATLIELPMLLRNPLAQHYPLWRILKQLKGRFKDGSDPQALREFFFGIARQHKGPLRLYGDKCPRIYVRQLPELVEAFPKAKIIMCVRDGRDVAASRAKREKTAEFGAERWLWLMELFEEAMKNPKVAERVLVVRFEEAAKDVEGLFERITDFVGMEPLPGDLELFRRIYRPRNIGTWPLICPDIEETAKEGFVPCLRRWGYE